MSAVCALPASIRSLSYSHLRRTRFGIALRTLTSRTSALFLRYCTLPIPLSFLRSGLAVLLICHKNLTPVGISGSDACWRPRHGHTIALS